LYPPTALEIVPEVCAHAGAAKAQAAPTIAEIKSLLLISVLPFWLTTTTDFHGTGGSIGTAVI
jgi:hypothetical protein